MQKIYRIPFKRMNNDYSFSDSGNYIWVNNDHKLENKVAKNPNLLIYI